MKRRGVMERGEVEKVLGVEGAGEKEVEARWYGLWEREKERK